MKKLLPILWTSTLLISLQGCSGQGFPGSQLFSQAEKEIPLKPLEAVKTSVNSKLLWKVATGSAPGNNKIHPYLSTNAVVVAGGSSVSAWNKTSGKVLWKNNLGEVISGGVNGGNGLIFVGTDKGNAVALDETNGKTRWIKYLGSEIQSVSEAKNGKVVFRTVNGKLYAANSNTGDIAWQQQQLTPVLSLHGTSVPVITGPYAIAGFDNGKLAAYELQSGKPAWETTLAVPRGSNELERMVDIDGKLNPIGTGMFTTSFNGRISGVDLKTGNVHWARPHSSYTGADADRNGVYTADAVGNVWKFEPQTGNPIWKMDDLVRRYPSAPTLINSNLIVVGDYQGNLHFINAINGQFAARISGDPAGYNVASKAEGNRVYSLGKGGVLSAISVQ